MPRTQMNKKFIDKTFSIDCLSLNKTFKIYLEKVHMPFKLLLLN
jgi:hypothetical protein